jgi:hypothetical protein
MVEGAHQYRHGLDKVVGTGANQDLSKLQQFRAQWADNFDPNVFRAENALRREDKKELAQIRKKSALAAWPSSSARARTCASSRPVSCCRERRAHGLLQSSAKASKAASRDDFFAGKNYRPPKTKPAADYSKPYAYFTPEVQREVGNDGTGARPLEEIPAASTRASRIFSAFR